MHGLRDIIIAAGSVLDTLLKIAVGVAVLVFFWGLARYLFNAADDKVKEEGKNRMIWGVIALFVMVSVWGLVYFLQVAFGLEAYLGPTQTLPPVRTTPRQICTQDPVVGQICSTVN